MLRALQAATESALGSEVREVYITTLLPVGKRLDDRLRRDLWTLIHCMLRLGTHAAFRSLDGMEILLSVEGTCDRGLCYERASISCVYIVWS